MHFTLDPASVADGEAVLPLAVVKQHLRVEPFDTEQDDLIEAFRDAAIDLVQRMTSKRLSVTAGIVRTSSEFGASALALGVGPLVSVESFTARDADGLAVAVDAALWRPEIGGSRIELSIGQRWPCVAEGAGAVRVEFTAGYAAGKCPPALKSAVLLMIGHLYANREAVVTGTIATSLPLGVEALCAPYRDMVI